VRDLRSRVRSARRRRRSRAPPAQPSPASDAHGQDAPSARRPARGARAPSRCDRAPPRSRHQSPGSRRPWRPPRPNLSDGAPTGAGRPDSRRPPNDQIVGEPVRHGFLPRAWSCRQSCNGESRPGIGRSMYIAGVALAGSRAGPLSGIAAHLHARAHRPGPVPAAACPRMATASHLHFTIDGTASAGPSGVSSTLTVLEKTLSKLASQTAV
jgi:hypothetical protein